MTRSGFAIFMSTAFLICGHAFAADLKIEVKGLQNRQAPIHLTLWDKPEGFLHATGRKATITGPLSSSATAVFPDLPPGEYTVAAYQDINGNKKLDYNFIGIPKEPIAISNDAPARFGPPKYEDAKFTVTRENLQIVVTLRD